MDKSIQWIKACMVYISRLAMASLITLLPTPLSQTYKPKMHNIFMITILPSLCSLFVFDSMTWLLDTTTI